MYRRFYAVTQILETDVPFVSELELRNSIGIAVWVRVRTRKEVVFFVVIFILGKGKTWEESGDEF